MHTYLVLRLRKKCTRNFLVLLVLILLVSAYVLDTSQPGLAVSTYDLLVDQKYSDVFLLVNANGYITPPGPFIIRQNETVVVKLLVGNLSLPISELLNTNETDLYVIDNQTSIFLPWEKIENLTLATDIRLDLGIKSYSPYPPVFITLLEPGHWLVNFQSPYLFNVTIDLYILPVDPVVEIHNNGWGTCKIYIKIYGANTFINTISISVDPRSSRTIKINGTGQPVVVNSEVLWGPIVFSIEDGKLIMNLQSYIVPILTLETLITAIVMFTVCRKKQDTRKVRRK
ncbi:hypothetical protein [Desulfurococcus amylolyticus]|uniref:Uncharacterized protein n=1 Tax=Desulfurococcus amylolyticus DSM 16532 TaxID=768672 RepID=I3XS46_DESAM|nr:hypothetical protein [Desulfurococcus amylolyticus]AFL66770.1 hypothetical protein Desfe_0882 [Desulfurococcus amylolyticus DSM 16532]